MKKNQGLHSLLYNARPRGGAAATRRRATGLVPMVREPLVGGESAQSRPTEHTLRSAGVAKGSLHRGVIRLEASADASLGPTRPPISVAARVVLKSQVPVETRAILPGLLFSRGGGRREADRVVYLVRPLQAPILAMNT